MKIKVKYGEDEFWPYTELNSDLEKWSWARGEIEIEEEFYKEYMEAQAKFEEMHMKLREIIDSVEK